MNNLSTTDQIVKFCESKLVDLLRDDWISGRIANERDCEHRIYHHLTNVLDQKFIINANVTITGYNVDEVGDLFDEFNASLVSDGYA